MATNRKPSKKIGIAVDFSETESQASLPEGDFLFEVEDVEQKTSESSGNDYLSLTFKVAEGEFKGKKVWHNCSLQPQALFNLRGVLEALGFEVPQGVMELDPADMIGETCGGTVQLEVYEGKDEKNNYWVDLEFRDLLSALSSKILYDMYDPKGIQGNLNTFSTIARQSISSALTTAYQKACEASSLELNDKNQKAAIKKWGEVLGYAFPDFS